MQTSRRGSPSSAASRERRERCSSGIADRLLFGTDLFPPDREIYEIHFRFLETADEHFPYSIDDPPPEGRWAISGLDLPDDVLRSVYEDNARRAIPGLAGRR